MTLSIDRWGCIGGLMIVAVLIVAVILGLFDVGQAIILFLVALFSTLRETK